MSASEGDDKRFEKLGERVKSMIFDATALTVITAEGEFEITPIKNEEDLIKSFNVNPTKITILAKTVIKLGGDTVNVIPVSGAGNFTVDKILELHEKSVITAETAWKDRLERIKGYILAINGIFGKELIHKTPN